MSAPHVDDISIAQAASTFAALGSEQRLTVLRSLVRAGPKGLTIGALGERTGITGATLTHHMKILAATKLVKQERHGRSIVCIAADYEELEGLLSALLSECCADCDAETCTPEAHCHEGPSHEGPRHD
ncbi:ArsR/SmtB family transcription factor [Celeribacter baekdonensis]|jgi:ArsR family transcriptional regulator, arsenate/arsenite/antimonite-responsive transcriptional repressor|uniref:Transcriptional regulator n=1 Tax=Celeribacter baekdonensis TaxID=875171 RepID=A0A2R4M436_9RHOB|nr:helix-turn-helix domain-containing protein [Celeribacter baekdonensis]AVW91970.1 transcriptional regulator [Celeribacter baekdonensis]|eukprot:TRINITY_DN29145_c0_g1_i1.p2 TRINITY_DN29145_c0_g1~~TRINITY_DN29145_c0_g1_i1.p2  ORF type:complete len:128 (-),score=5.70 TRINITY_DN29145_c0_g1_i1:215-598(-)